MGSSQAFCFASLQTLVKSLSSWSLRSPLCHPGIQAVLAVCFGIFLGFSTSGEGVHFGNEIP